jgi:hypothetical protein
MSNWSDLDDISRLKAKDKTLGSINSPLHCSNDEKAKEVFDFIEKLYVSFNSRIGI